MYGIGVASGDILLHRIPVVMQSYSLRSAVRITTDYSKTRLPGEMMAKTGSTSTMVKKRLRFFAIVFGLHYRCLWRR